MRISDWSSDVCSSDLLVQGGLGLPDRDYYLSDDAGLVGKRNAYRDYLVQLLTLAGEPNAEARAAAILTLESDIAEAHWTQVDSRDAQKTYNKWTRDQFAKSAPGFAWDGYLEDRKSTRLNSSN